MKLLIVESPAKAKTVSKYLDKNFKVEASIGHVRDIPKSGKNAIDIENGFVPNYEVVEGKEKIIEKVKTLSKKAEDVLLATDPDREGEAIAWHLKEAASLKNPKRVVFHEITKEAIEKAIKEPRGIDENLKKAQEARRVLDRLIGYGLSGIIWKKIRYGLSAGRVQSPALRIIMERERRIRDFIPEDYWTIMAKAKTEDKEEFEIICEEEPKTKEETNRIVKEAENSKWLVKKISETSMKRSPKAPFTTSTLQQAASSRMGFSPSKTMRTAQRLYEAGAITYMRTDSVQLAVSAKEKLKNVIKSKFGDDYYQGKSYKTKSKSAQEAHEAIRPTEPAKESLGKTEDEKKLYSLIKSRALSSQMKEAQVLKTKIVANTEKEQIPNFSTHGTRILFEGWFKAEPAARAEENELPKVKEGENLEILSVGAEAKQTKPPSRYTEAGLIKELEKAGIGRPSTYASIMQTLSNRHYVEKEGKTLFPTDTGEVVTCFLEDNFPNYVNDSFTASMENRLDEIAEGNAEYEKTLKNYYTPFTEKLEEKKDVPKVTTLGDASAEFKCPKCKASMVIKLGKSGKFMSCSLFPKCDGARTMEGEEIEKNKKTGEECPECGAELVEKAGRFGKFISCEKYPKCKYTKDLAKNEQKSTEVKCPKCGKGEMTEKRGKFGPFFACSNYPECKYTIKAKPTGNNCSECGELMMEGTKTIPERCSNKNCANHNPPKKQK